MTILTDGKRTVGITMMVWEGNGYSPDWSQDFFEVGVLPRRETVRGVEYIVDNVDYCIDQANNWECRSGDYREDETDVQDERRVDVDDLKCINIID